MKRLCHFFGPTEPKEILLNVRHEKTLPNLYISLERPIRSEPAKILFNIRWQFFLVGYRPLNMPFFKPVFEGNKSLPTSI